jgi:hypothetical protein
VPWEGCVCWGMLPPGFVAAQPIMDKSMASSKIATKNLFMQIPLKHFLPVCIISHDTPFGNGFSIQNFFIFSGS